MTPAPGSFEILSPLARTRPRPALTATLRAALHSHRLLLLKALLVRADRTGDRLSAAVRRRLEDDWTLLVRAEQTDAAAVRDVVDYPTIGAWLAEALAVPDGPEFEEHLGRLTGPALAAAVRAGCRFGTERVLTAPALNLPGLGLLRCRPGQVTLTAGADGLRVTADGDSVLAAPVAGPNPRAGNGALSWSALRPLPDSAAVLDDQDPYRAPPDGIGPAALRAAERPHTDHPAWAARWRDARVLLSATDPGRVAETTALVRAVVPLATPARPGTPTSATLHTAPGAVLSQLPATPADLVELLVHETHHTKLAALDELLPLCRPDGRTLHRVGWRRDPRPVPGVLQGAYAHLALLDLWHRARDSPTSFTAWRRRAAERFEAHRERVGEALSILRESDELTSAGREFVHGMVACHERLGSAADRPGNPA
ncbi:HEXXH motif-containing protein [Streptomyces sp. SAI-170]|uniref:aKG-HExxH-type peptide beta-hydroxylase n=1 Tax=Streptomyces sp. SAI-170 TaxID=3377729 RepID=UPI003C7D4CA0